MGRNNETRVVRFIEGMAVTGEFYVKTLARGDHLALLEVLVPKGGSSPLHIHHHESVIYVLRGKLRTTIDGEAVLLGPGDSCVQPRDVEHSVEAMEETLFLEIKSPVPNLDDFFKS